jgi:hypothetical protein
MLIDIDLAMGRACDNNCLCYNENAPDGELSYRLLDTMLANLLKPISNTGESLEGDELQYIYCEPSVRFPVGWERWGYHNCEIRFVDDLTIKYLQLDGYLAAFKKNIVLGVGKQGKVILGCY